MAKQKTVPIIFALVVSVYAAGCTDSGEDFNHAGLYGSWEMVIFHEDHQLNQVNSLELNRDGSYQRSTTYRDPDTDAQVGYYHFQEGTYNLDGESIAFEAVQNLYIGNEAAWGAFEELKEVEIHAATQPIRSTLEYREGGSKLAVHTVCNDVLLSMCAPSPVYSRVTT